MIGMCTRFFVLGLLGAHAALGQTISFVRHLSGAQSLEGAVAVTRDATAMYVLTTASVRKVDFTGAVNWMRPVAGGRSIVANGSGVYVAGVTRRALPGDPRAVP